MEKFCEDFVCSVCLCIPFPEHAIEATCCGSFFCLPCLKGCREKKEICPNCNGEFRTHVPRLIREGNRFALKKLLGLVVYCDTKFLEDSSTPDGATPFDDDDPPQCTWEGTWADLSAHLRKCDYVNVSCLWNNCPKIIPRRLAEEHEKICNFRTIFCCYCNSALPHNVLEKHHTADCQQFPVECPDCKMSGIARSKLASHLSTECPLGVVACVISGCAERICRKDVQTHEADCPHREVKCQFCDQALPYFKLTDHHAADCERVLVNCSHNCGCDPMERRNLPSHEEVCPTYPVTCMFQGCSVKVERRALEAHMQESMALHFQILCTQVSSLQNVVSSLTTTLFESKEQVSSLTKQVAEKDKIIAELKKNTANDRVITNNTSTRLDSAVEQIHALEHSVKKLRGTSVSHMYFGPFYVSLQYAVGTVSFHAADAEWVVYMSAAKAGPSLFLKFNSCNNGPLITGAKISFSFTIYPNSALERVLTISTSKLEIFKYNMAGVKIDGFVAGLSNAPYRITIYDFKVDEFICA